MQWFDFSHAKGRCGIYTLRNKRSGDRYVGQAKDIAGRWKKHLAELKVGKKQGQLQEDWVKYGPEAFEFIILRERGPKYLDVLGACGI